LTAAFTATAKVAAAFRKFLSRSEDAMTDISAELKQAKERLGYMAKASPEVFSGFSRLAKAATAQGTNFSPAQRELIAAAIAVTKGCDDCILYHVDAAIRQGADEKALVETLEVAVEMGGGPALMYAGRALAAFQELAAS